MSIFVPMLLKGYNSSAQTVSELSATGNPTRMLWILPGTVYTLLVTAFGWGAWQSAAQNRNLRITGELILANGIISILWSFASMHQREALAS